jgi:hypothetical protein
MLETHHFLKWANKFNKYKAHSTVLLTHRSEMPKPLQVMLAKDNLRRDSQATVSVNQAKNLPDEMGQQVQ